MKCKIVAFILFFLIVYFGYSQEFHISDYVDYQKQVNLLEKNLQYDQAIKLTRDVLPAFPDREFELLKELIWLNGKTQQYEKNLEIWEAGHRKGFFFLLNKRMKKYEPYLEFEQFGQLVQTDEKLRLDSFQKSQTIHEVFLPADWDSTKRYPVIFILHGGGSNLEKTKKRWQIIPPMQSNYIVVFLQSYRHMDSNTFGWTSGDKRAHRDVRACFDSVCVRYPADTTKVLLGGVSAGGTMAFDLAFNRIIPVKGIVGICPGKPWHLSVEKVSSVNPKIFMIGGETDFYRTKQEELASMFKEAGLDYRYHLVEGMGHEFPADYEKMMQEALWFITGN